MSRYLKSRYNVVMQLPGDAKSPTAKDVKEELDGFVLDRPGGGRINVSRNSATEDYPATWEEYWHNVKWDAKAQFDETRKHVMDESDKMDWDFLSDGFASTVAEYAVEDDRYVDMYPRATISHADNGFYGEGHARFVAGRETTESSEMIRSLAAAAYFNDVKAVVKMIQDARKSLGEAIYLMDDEGKLWSDDVEFTYEYEQGIVNPEIHTFTFKHKGANVWQMIDPDGNQFESISPDAHFYNNPDEDDLDWKIPEVSFELWLNNMCAKRLREVSE